MEAYRYCVVGSNGGIVLADSKDDALDKLRLRYGLEAVMTFTVWKASDDDFYNPDYPDVYECY